MTHSRSLLTIIKVMFLITIAVLLATNPGRAKYEQYAAKALNSYLKERVCQDLTEVLTSPCNILVELARPQLKLEIANKTQRKNYLLFSIYETDLSLPSTFPDYHFETVGILDYFYTYQAENLD